MNQRTLLLIIVFCCAYCLHLIINEFGVSTSSPNESVSDVAPTTAELPPENPEPQPIDKPQEEPAPEVAGPTPKVAFEPPYPNRTDLFQAPKRQGGMRVNSNDQSETSVELLGFVDVDGPRVALSIDGQVKMVSEGDKESGIEVISIKPPSVVLQRGRQRWQATFEN